MTTAVVKCSDCGTEGRCARFRLPWRENEPFEAWLCLGCCDLAAVEVPSDFLDRVFTMHVAIGNVGQRGGDDDGAD